MNISKKRERIHDMLLQYIETVDARDTERWADYFAAESSYQVITSDNYARGSRSTFLVLDDNKNKILDRVLIIRKIWSGNYNPYIPRHLMTVLRITPADEEEGEFEAWSNFSVYVTETSGYSQLLAVGRYLDRIVFEGDTPKFKERRVVLDTEVLPRYFVYPL